MLFTGTNPIGVSAVVLIALDVGLHIDRRHQPNLMATTANHPRPMMSAASSLHAHQTRRQLPEKLLDRGSPKLAPHHDSSRRINPVNLKNVLRQIQTNRANLRHGRLPLSGSTQHRQSGTSMPFGGRPPHHCERSEAIQSPSAA